MKSILVAFLVLVILISGCIGQDVTPTTTTSTTICADIRCVWDPCPDNHLPDENGCINCASPCATTTTSPTPTETIKIAAFNIQIFGKSKREKTEVMDVLSMVAREFDVMLVQEIRDSSETTAPIYLDKINELPGSTYAFVRSERLGRTSSKEAYAYFYNTETVDFIEGSDYVYNDTGDVFEREPYIASFKSGNFDFTLVGIHTKPDDAESEIRNLTSVVSSITSERDIIVMGDFNADGTYFDEDSYGPFKTPETQSALPIYRWIITNDMDTMTKTDWTYDRIVIQQETVNEYIWDSGNVFYFDTEYGITNQTLVEDVSDHYPVFAEFNTALADDD